MEHRFYSDSSLSLYLFYLIGHHTQQIPLSLRLLLRPPQPLLLLLYLGSFNKHIASHHFLISLPPILYKHAVILAKHE